MRIVSVAKTGEEIAFARRAVTHLSEHPSHYTFAEGDPAPGGLFAIRWNPFTVLVVKLDETHIPACYPVHEFIAKDLPPLQGEPYIP